MQVAYVYEFRPDDPRQQLPRTPDGSEGPYKVTFIISVPGKNVFREELDMGKIMNQGESLLQTPPGLHLKATLSNENGSAEIIFRSNSKAQIATAQMRIQAKSFVEAEQVAYDFVAPQLSYWSYLYDVAIDITGYEVLEEKTESTKYSFGVLGRVKAFNKEDVEGISMPVYRKFFSAYREGMNATNPFYQALSFYKVAEGVKAERVRNARQNRTYQKGVTPTYDDEQFPKSLDEVHVGDVLSKDAFAPYLGQDFLTVLEKFADLIRNAIAHLSQLDAVLDADRFNDVSICYRAIPILRYVAHRMLENELKHYNPNDMIVSNQSQS